MSIVDRKQRAKEEKILLFQTLMEGATTEEDVIRVKLDYDFINDCLEV